MATVNSIASYVGRPSSAIVHEIEQDALRDVQTALAAGVARERALAKADELELQLPPIQARIDAAAQRIADLAPLVAMNEQKVEEARAVCARAGSRTQEDEADIAMAEARHLLVEVESLSRHESNTYRRESDAARALRDHIRALRAMPGPDALVMRELRVALDGKGKK